jgi:Uma2 family endonuclease
MSSTLRVNERGKDVAYQLVPPLENGEHLTRDEFERRYEAMPWLKKAELIEGKVYLGSPVIHSTHGKPHGRIGGWLYLYQAETPGTDYGDNSTVRLAKDSEPQPDGFLIILPECGGQTILGGPGYIEGAPELAVEVASSSASYDLHEKLRAYKHAGVKEYVVWRTRDKIIDWLVLRGGEYVQLKAESGVFRSETFPGLWLNTPALIDYRMSIVNKTLNEGLASPEHAAFVAELRRRAEEAGKPLE